METLGTVLGKAHKLVEWLREDDSLLEKNQGTIPMSWAIEGSTKWHIGDSCDLPQCASREIIDELPLRLPVKQMLIESESSIRMADGRDEPLTEFLLCYDRGNEEIDCFMFGFAVGRYFYHGGGKLSRSKETGKHESLGFFRDRGNGKESPDKKIIEQGLGIVELTILALGCTNVTSVDNAPSSSLNKKRQRQGKPPVFTYKLLQISAGERNGCSTNTATDKARGVRLHFRRGHVRRLGDGRITWVQQCMVGSKSLGVVEKAYSLVTH